MSSLDPIILSKVISNSMLTTFDAQTYPLMTEYLLNTAIQSAHTSVNNKFSLL